MKFSFKIIIPLYFLVSISWNLKSYAQKYLPFEINSVEYNSLKKAVANFDKGKYSKSILDYNKSAEIVRYFPFEQYKLSLCYYKTGDTTQAQEVFYQALNNGLSFQNIEYFNRSPLIRELSKNEHIYQLAKSTCYSDSLCQFKLIRKKLIILREKDQKVRTEFDYELDTMGMAETDSMNRIELKTILSKIGWPGIKEVGKEGENSAFLIAQHADNDSSFQKKCLFLMRGEFLIGNISINHYAMLLDRFLINSGGNQIFGSQVFFDEAQNKFVAEPCLYPNEVDFLRKLFLLGSLDDYLKLMNNKN